MVDAIKSLTDLRRIEAAIRVTCRDCGHVRMIDREACIRERLFHRASLDWNSVCASLPCWNAQCSSRNTRVEALPFSQDRIELKRKRGETILMNLALTVLKEAAYRGRDKSIATVDVRLALRVLYPYLGSQVELRAYWDAACAERARAWEECHVPFARIVGRLVDQGYAVEAELL